MKVEFVNFIPGVRGVSGTLTETAKGKQLRISFHADSLRNIPADATQLEIIEEARAALASLLEYVKGVIDEAEGKAR